MLYAKHGDIGKMEAVENQPEKNVDHSYMSELVKNLWK